MAARIAGDWSTFYWLLERACYAVYAVLPSFQPYAEQLKSVSVSLRAAAGDARIVLLSAGYALACLSFYYSLSVWLLRRRDLS